MRNGNFIGGRKRSFDSPKTMPGRLRPTPELTGYLQPIVAARREEPRNDIISDLVQAEVDGKRFTDDEVLSHVRLIFSAGAGTVHDAMGNLFYHLLLRSDLWEAIKRDPSMRFGVVEELLRFETSVPVLPRTSAADPIVFEGTTIPPNSFMLFAIASANRDPDFFPDPHAFKTDRPPKPIMTTFGPGPRACPGMHLARKELALVLDASRSARLRHPSPVGSGTERGQQRLLVRHQHRRIPLRGLAWPGRD